MTASPSRLSLHLAGLVLLIAGNGAPAAQDGLPTRAPADPPLVATKQRPWLRAHIAGGRQLRAAFLPTNLGSLLVSQEGQPILTDGTELVGALLQPVTKRSDLIESLVSAFGEFDGSIELEIAPAKLPAELVHLPYHDRREPPIAGCLRLHADDADQLRRLHAAIEAALDATVLASEKVEIGDRKLRVYRASRRVAISAPRIMGSDCVMLFGDPLASWKRYVAEARPGRTAASRTEWTAAPIRCEVDLGSAFDYIAASGSMAGGVDSFRAAGFMCLDRLYLTVQPIGPRVAIETRVTLRDDFPRGVISGWLEQAAGLPRFLHQVPAEEPDWTLGKLNLARIAEGFLDGEEAGGMKNLRKNRKVQDFLKLLHAISPDYLQLGSVLPGPEDDWHGKFSIAFRIADTAAFDAALEDLKPHWLLREQDPLDSRIASQVWSLPLFVIEPRLVRFGDFVMLTADRDPARDMESIVAWCEAPAPEQGLASELRNERPPGMHGLGRVSLRNAMRSTLHGLAILDLPEDLSRGRVDRILERLERAQLGAATWVAGYDKEGYRARLIW